MVKFELHLSPEAKFLNGSMKAGHYDSWAKMKNSAPGGVYFDVNGSLTENRKEEFEVETPGMNVAKFPVVYRQAPQDKYRTIGIVHIIRE